MSFFCLSIVIFTLLCIDTSQIVHGAPGSQSLEETCVLPQIRTMKKIATSARSSCPKDELAAVTSKLAELFDQYWKWKLREYPEEATSNGIHLYDDRLTRVSIGDFNRRYDDVLDFLDTIENMEPCVKDPKDIQNLKVMKHELSNFKEGHRFQGYYFATDNIWGVDHVLPHVFNRMPLDSMKDYETMISRLEQIPSKLRDVVEVMRAGMDAGIVLHHVSVVGLNESIGKNVVSDPSSSVFYKYFEKDFPATFSTEEISRLQERAKQVIRDEVVHSFEMLRNFFDTEYKTRENIAISSIPNGKETYQRFIRIHTQTDFTAQQVHDVGQCEVKRISSNMQKISEELGHSDKALEDVIDLIQEDPNNYYPTTESLLRGYEEIVEAVDLELPKVFKRIPSFKVKLEGDPSPTATVAYYRSPSLDGRKSGVFVVGTNNIQSSPKYTMKTLTLHEASPGHHHQISHAMEFSNLPMFRRANIGSTYTTSGFPSSTAYTEGWALYAEKLGFEMNLYDDPLYRFGHYTDEMLRACRLVVDTGMHALGWSREQAIDFMDRHLAFDRQTITGEVDRYITWPGQALGYKIGQLRFLTMRRNAEDKLGSSFDLKEFHDVVLNVGNAPLDIVQEEVEAYIASLVEEETEEKEEERGGVGEDTKQGIHSGGNLASPLSIYNNIFVQLVFFYLLSLCWIL